MILRLSVFCFVLSFRSADHLMSTFDCTNYRFFVLWITYTGNRHRNGISFEMNFYEFIPAIFFVSLCRIFSIFSVIIEYNARMYHHKPVFFPSIFKSWRLLDLQNYFVQFENICSECGVIRSRISMFSLKWIHYIWYVWLSSILRFWPWAVHKLAANNKLLLFIKTKRAMSWTCRQI